MIPITDDRLIELIDTCKNSLDLPEEYESHPQVREHLEIYQELLRLRGLVKRLVEDGERLYMRVKHSTICPANKCYADDCECGITRIEELHRALLAEIKDVNNG